MALFSFLLAASFHYSVIAFHVLLTAASESISPFPDPSTSIAQRACQLLKESLPQSVAFPESAQFSEDVHHWAVTSEQNATCSVEPRNPTEVSTILRLVGRPDIRAPFAVKSGGHAYDLGQSSTPGVQISLNQFNNLSYDAARGLVTIGVGLTWDEVYERLEPLGVMVTGGRTPGIGVGGLSLGGGYSWKTNQYGLTVDTIVSHDLVLPSGQMIRVTNTSHPDIFFALKGGLNNFGIVTSITFEVHPQTMVFGGSLTYSIDNITSLNNAISKFSSSNTDAKAQIIVSYAAIANQFIANIFIFYDAPTAPEGVFDDFFAIPVVVKNISTRTFVDFMSVFNGGDLGIGTFGIAQHCIPVLKYTGPILDEIITQITSLSVKLNAQSNDSLVVVSVAPELFTNPFSHSRGGAYPHPPSRQVTPASPFIAYQTDPNGPLAIRNAKQATFVQELKQLVHNVQARAVEEGQSRWDDLLYPNYALDDTPLELMYGSNTKTLRSLAHKYDPQNVMGGLTGGLHFNS